MTHDAERQSAELTTVGRLGRVSWRVHDTSFGDCVLTLADPEELLLRRRAIRRLQHPQTHRELSLVSVPGHGPGLVTNYLPGVPLSEMDSALLLRRPSDAARIGVQVLDILGHAHERGVVHGRLTAERVIVGESVGLVGFGLAPDGATARHDLQSLGALLYELVTGVTWSSWAPRASQVRPELGRAFDEWLETLTDPEHGFEGAEQMRVSLRAVGATMPPPPRLVPAA